MGPRLSGPTDSHFLRLGRLLLYLEPAHVQSQEHLIGCYILFYFIFCPLSLPPITTFLPGIFDLALISSLGPERKISFLFLPFVFDIFHCHGYLAIGLA